MTTRAQDLVAETKMEALVDMAGVYGDLLSYLLSEGLYEGDWTAYQSLVDPGLSVPSDLSTLRMANLLRVMSIGFNELLKLARSQNEMMGDLVRMVSLMR